MGIEVEVEVEIKWRGSRGSSFFYSIEVADLQEYPDSFGSSDKIEVTEIIFA